MISTWLRRLAIVIVWLPVVAYAGQVSHQFFVTADSAITLSTDDGVGNISYALATEGRYGFLSSPVLAGMARHDGLFSYGPFYFYLGAALIWVFGYSIVLLRTIHLVVILGIAAAGGVWFRKAGSGGVGALAALGLLMAFERGQWPMVRPDSLVSLFAVALVIAAGRAIATGGAWYWFAAGVAASCGAFTHLAAWALVPGAAVILGVAQLADARDERGAWRWPPSLWRSLLAIVAGGSVGVAAFYASFGFRFRDQLAFLTDYQKYTGSLSEAAGGSFRELVTRHFELAYWYLPYPMAYLVVGSLIVSIVAVGILTAWAALTGRRVALALLAPPTVVWVIYLASLGVYNNFHQGYAILNQVMWLWTTAAFGAATLELLRRWPSWHRVAGVTAWVIAVAVGVGLLTVFGQRTNYRALAAEALTPIGQYVDHVIEAMPARASAWGTVEFGIEHPGRLQLVQFWDGIKVLDVVPPDRRAHLAPDYLVWGHVENGMNAATVIGASGLSPDRALDVAALVGPWRLFNVFPDPRYTLVSMTAGTPYGVTRVYAWKDGAPALDRPMVSVYDPKQHQWVSAVGAAANVATSPSDAGSIRLPAGSVHTAVQTLRGELPAGLYLLKVRLAAGLPSALAAVVSASPSRVVETDVTQASSGVDVSPWFVDQTEVFLIYEHAGGPFYVSQYGTAVPALQGVEASAVKALTNYRGRRREVPPEHAIPVTGWMGSFPEIAFTADAAAGLASVGGNSVLYGYQAYGPKLPVQPGQRMRLRIPVTVTAGRGCLGVLDETLLRWLLAPDRLLPEYEFPVDNNHTVMPVLADCSGSPTTVTPLKATIGNGTYAVWSDRDELYVDRLMREFENARPR